METKTYTINQAVEHLHNGGAIENDIENVELLYKIIWDATSGLSGVEGGFKFYFLEKANPDYKEFTWNRSNETDKPTIKLSQISDRTEELTTSKACKYIGDCDLKCLTVCHKQATPKEQLTIEQAVHHLINRKGVIFLDIDNVKLLNVIQKATIPMREQSAITYDKKYIYLGTEFLWHHTDGADNKPIIYLSAIIPPTPKGETSSQIIVDSSLTCLCSAPKIISTNL